MAKKTYQDMRSNWEFGEAAECRCELWLCDRPE